MLVPRIEPGISFAGYRRAIRFILPYWPRLILILLAGAIATAFGLAQPYISKLLIDDALLKRDLHMLGIVRGLMILVTGLEQRIVNHQAADDHQHVEVALE